MENIDPSADKNPQSGLPFIVQMMNALGAQGQQSARQVAMAVATNGESEPNVDPIARMEFEELGRVAELHIAKQTGLSPSRSGSVIIEPLTKAGWAGRSVDALKPLLESLGSPQATKNFEFDENSFEWIDEIMTAIAPLMAEITAGTLVGRLASRGLGSYDMPIPRDDDRIPLIASNIDSFANEWSLPIEEVRLWICLHEIAHHTILGVPHIRMLQKNLLTEHAAGFNNQSEAFKEHLSEIDLINTPEALLSLQEILNPESILSAVRSPEQIALLPKLDALVALIIGFVDHIMDKIGEDLIPSYQMVTEALRRRRITTSDTDRFVEKILGLNLTQEQVDRGSTFVSGVVERAGFQELGKLWADKVNLPTPNEIDAPGLWLERINLNIEN